MRLSDVQTAAHLARSLAARRWILQRRDSVVDRQHRAALLGFIFAGANVARLAVPLRFGVAFALAPWVDENIVQKFGGGGDSKEE